MYGKFYKTISFEQQESPPNICTDSLNDTENDQHLLGRIITCHETWFFTYDPETKRQSMHWKANKLEWANQNSKQLWLFFDYVPSLGSSRLNY